MTSKKREIALYNIEKLAEKITASPEIYKNMQKELAKTKDFATRLEIVADTIENIFRAQNNQPLLSYSEYRKLRKKKNKKHKNQKGIKNYKRWK